MVLEETLESLLDCKEIQPVNPKGSQSWIFFGRTDAEAETPILWPPDEKNWLIWKDPDAGKNWRQEKRKTEDEMVGWHPQLDGYEFEQAPEVGDRQGNLVCCSPWGCKESDMTEWLNWTELNAMTQLKPVWKHEWNSHTTQSFILAGIFYTRQSVTEMIICKQVISLLLRKTVEYICFFFF